MINIITNAKDAFIVNNQKTRQIISINLSEKNNKIIIAIQDNAGGIEEDIIKNIFNPYFSTKSKKNGTGLGLYIAKVIVEEHMNGELTVRNKDDGALFQIELEK